MALCRSSSSIRNTIHSLSTTEHTLTNTLFKTSEYWATGGADGIVYVSNNEHTPTLPPERGWGLIALNATTGQFLWKVTGNTHVSCSGI